MEDLVDVVGQFVIGFCWQFEIWFCEVGGVGFDLLLVCFGEFDVVLLGGLVQVFEGMGVVLCMDWIMQVGFVVGQQFGEQVGVYQFVGVGEQDVLWCQ